MTTKQLCLTAMAALFIFQSCQKEKNLSPAVSTTKETSKRTTAVFAFSNLLRNNMVIQRNKTDRVWGTGTNGHQMTVKIVNTSTNVTITASPVTVDGSGNWVANLNIGNASINSHTITCTDNSNNTSISITNVLIGDVWVCSGQSNMVMPMKRIDDPAQVFGGFYGVENYTAEINAANFPNMRYLTVATVANNGGTNNDIGGSGDWKGVTPSTAGDMSATAYYFGRKVYQGLSSNVPVGLIVAAVGNTGAEEWVSQSTLTSMSSNGNVTTQYWNDGDRCRWYNGMIYPMRNLSPKGIIWYQGEFNVGQPYFDYHVLFLSLTTNWRSTFNNSSTMPFYFVQIAPCGYNSPFQAAEIRLAQANVRLWDSGTTFTGMACIVDRGEHFNIHPIAKIYPGERMALAALYKTYGQTATKYLGPQYSSLSQSGNFVTLSFNNATSLTSYNGSNAAGSINLGAFYVAQNDNLYYKVKSASIVNGNQVKLENPYLGMTITHIRYLFDEHVYESIKNADGLPMEPFRF